VGPFFGLVVQSSYVSLLVSPVTAHRDESTPASSSLRSRRLVFDFIWEAPVREEPGDLIGIPGIINFRA